MTVGLSTTNANGLLNALVRGTNFTALTGLYVQLHTGDPGAAGTSNVATETDRVQATFGTNAASGTISNTASLTWSAVAGTEDYTHYSVWSASTTGTFFWSGTVTANPVTAGDDFVIAIGDIDLSFPVAA